MGDVNGIGPELLLKTFEDNKMSNFFTPVVYGSGKAFYFYKNQLNYPKFNYKQINDITQIVPNKLNFVECSPGFEKVVIGQPSVDSGKAAFLALQKAVSHLKEGKIHALITLPINKKTIQNENFNFPGHTEYLASEFEMKENLMLMVHDSLRVAVVTGHIPISKVSQSISIDGIYNKIKILNECLKMDFGITKPKIAVLGLNPHSGDNGLIGEEDLKIIVPSVKKAYDEGILAWGPFPADGFFAHASYLKYDAVLAMYHDQGLIPFKTLANGKGVNYTAGMSIIRTSPDHGTAYDIAGKNIADAESFHEAIYLAIDCLRKRVDNIENLSNKLKAHIPSDTLQEEEIFKK